MASQPMNIEEMRQIALFLGMDLAALEVEGEDPYTALFLKDAIMDKIATAAPLPILPAGVFWLLSFQKSKMLMGFKFSSPGIVLFYPDTFVYLKVFPIWVHKIYL